MQSPKVCRIPYRRSRFSTQLPTDRIYTPSHFWLRQLGDNHYQVGYTRFAVRMLGDLVEYGFEVKPHEKLELGQIVGWIEAFKATTDIYCVGEGSFGEANPQLETKPDTFDKDPYGAGWLYTFHGTPDPAAVDAEAYTKMLDKAIDKIQGKDSPFGPDAEANDSGDSENDQ